MICVALAYNNFPSFEECGRKIIFYQLLGGLKIKYKFKFFSKLPVFKERRITICVYVFVYVTFFLYYIPKSSHSSQEKGVEIYNFGNTFIFF